MTKRTPQPQGAGERPSFYKEVAEKPRPCASDDEFRAYINEDPKRFTPAERAQLEHHLAGCAACQEKFIKVMAEIVKHDNVAQLSADTQAFSEKAQRIMNPEKKNPHFNSQMLEALQSGRLRAEDLEPEELEHLKICAQCLEAVTAGNDTSNQKKVTQPAEPSEDGPEVADEQPVPTPSRDNIDLVTSLRVITEQMRQSTEERAKKFGLDIPSTTDRS
jgi:hypothetical protein